MFLTGRIIITGIIIGTIIGAWAADWNDSHVFNENWPPHARFHSVVLLFTLLALGLVCLWLLWKKSSEKLSHCFVAAALPFFYWGNFFTALLIPGTSVEDKAGTLPTVFGFPLNIVVAFSLVAGSLAGFFLCLYGFKKESDLRKQFDN